MSEPAEEGRPGGGRAGERQGGEGPGEGPGEERQGGEGRDDERRGDGGLGPERPAAPLLLLLSGPNLNLLGKRQPEIYGTSTLADHVAAAGSMAARLGLTLEHHQSNHEGELVEHVHAARDRAAAIIINPGALTHYGWSLHDALAAFDGPIVELHLSNPDGREPWRRTSVVASVATGTISGFGGHGYRLAVEAVAALLGLAPGSAPR